MKTLIIYYSYSGHTKKIAEELEVKESADIVEIKDAKCPGKLKAYVLGCFASMRGKAWSIQPLETDIAAYERLILMAPIWAGSPAPAFNSLMAQLPEGKIVSVKMVSASGKSGCRERLEAVIREKRCVPEGFEDIKT